MPLRRAISSLLVLVALLGAFGQSMAYAAPMTGGAPMFAAAVDCAGMAMAALSDHQQPCQGLTLECIDKMGCVAGSILPAPLATIVERVSYTPIYYVFPTGSDHGVTVEPEIFPPIV